MHRIEGLGKEMGYSYVGVNNAIRVTEYKWIEYEDGYNERKFSEVKKYLNNFEQCNFYYMKVMEAGYPLPFWIKRLGIWGDPSIKDMLIRENCIYNYVEGKRGRYYYGVGLIKPHMIKELYDVMIKGLPNDALIVSKDELNLSDLMSFFKIDKEITINYSKLINYICLDRGEVIARQIYTDDISYYEIRTLDIFHMIKRLRSK